MSDHAIKQAYAQYESIRQFVNALDLDFDRLEELRQSLRDYVADHVEEFEISEDAAAESWRNTYPDEAKELAELEKVVEGHDWASEADVLASIGEDPLEISVGYSGWYRPGETPDPDTYRILLCTGGPAVQITGRLDDNNEPETAKLQWQDWGTPWTDYYVPRFHGPEVDEEVLLRYAREFYFGEL